MKDYLSVIITDGEHEWQQQGIAIPRVGDHITCRRDGSLEKVFGGEVDHVHWEVREGRPGMIVTVWLKSETRSPQPNVAPDAAARLERILRLGRSMKWTPHGAPALDDEETAVALGELFQIFFQDAVDRALNASEGTHDR